MTINKLRAELQDHITEAAKYKKTYENKICALGKTLLALSFKEYLTLHPMVHSLKWTQYTPWFMDGETCEFSVNDLSVQFDPEVLGKAQKRQTIYKQNPLYPRRKKEAGHSWSAVPHAEIGDYNDGYLNWWDLKYDLSGEGSYFSFEKFTNKELQPIVKKAESLRLDDLVMELCFGDHVKIIYTRDNGFDGEEHEHD